jgi:hypothetical protein
MGKRAPTGAETPRQAAVCLLAAAGIGAAVGAAMYGGKRYGGNVKLIGRDAKRVARRLGLP